jgi:Mg2+/Co2+ transporter CorB
MATAKETGEASGSDDRARRESSLEELLRSLNLKGDEIGGLFVARNEVEALKESTKWMAVMRVLTSKAFSATSLKRRLWSLRGLRRKR